METKCRKYYTESVGTHEAAASADYLKGKGNSQIMLIVYRAVLYYKVSRRRAPGLYNRENCATGWRVARPVNVTCPRRRRLCRVQRRARHGSPLLCDSIVGRQSRQLVMITARRRPRRALKKPPGFVSILRTKFRERLLNGPAVVSAALDSAEYAAWNVNAARWARRSSKRFETSSRVYVRH
ncbi:hypothetical protein EVAR_31995_1 [Eumeta japonica]|uniref:Uncharacterized protein n=1 Tax=Eumeta variegata TaxID=151549 RepID=A0A4C1VTN3_EUMVA|nr:hypothetical protein EVAR_31995_1 [Eumeta japonica]